MAGHCIHGGTHVVQASQSVAGRLQQGQSSLGSRFSPHLIPAKHCIHGGTHVVQASQSVAGRLQQGHSSLGSRFSPHLIPAKQFGVQRPRPVKKARNVGAVCSLLSSTRAPHSGYHYEGTPRRFFEGWYFKISLPEEGESLAWMYSIEDPFKHLGAKSLKELPLGESITGLLGMAGGPVGDLLGFGPRFPGVGAQILGPDDQYLFQYDTDTDKFWASRYDLALGGVFQSRGSSSVKKISTELPPREFEAAVEEGFQVSTTLHQGFLRDNGKSPDLSTVETCRWEYTTRPVYGYGDVGGEQLSLAGWLAVVPIFEPHWQVCMAGGLSTGWVEWGDRRYEFVDAPSYCEKNWGGSFPSKWFWVQCNVFSGVEGEMALTAGGGRRASLLSPTGSEEIAMVGVHYGGKLYNFQATAGEVSWDIATWGRWTMQAYTADYEVELEATTSRDGTVLRAPTSMAGLVPSCKDTFFGSLRISIWERTSSGAKGQVVVEATSDMAALEVGGGPWWGTWKNSSKLVDPARSLISAPINPSQIFSSAPPELRPPGL